jgi:hypothetical protein
MHFPHRQYQLSLLMIKPPVPINESGVNIKRIAFSVGAIQSICAHFQQADEEEQRADKLSVSAQKPPLTMLRGTGWSGSKSLSGS